MKHLKWSGSDMASFMVMSLSAASLMFFYNDNYKIHVVCVLGALAGALHCYMGRRLDQGLESRGGSPGFLWKTTAVHSLLIPLSLNFLCRRFNVGHDFLPFKLAVFNRIVIIAYIAALFLGVIRPFLNARFFRKADVLSIITCFTGALLLSYSPLSALTFFGYKPANYLNPIAGLLVAHVFSAFAAVFVWVDLSRGMGKKRWNRMALFLVSLLSFFTLATVTDNIYLYYSGRHFDSELWGYVFDRQVMKNAGIYCNFHAFFIAAAVVSAMGLFLAGLWKTTRNLENRPVIHSLSSIVMAGYTGVAAVCVLFILAPEPRNSSQYETWNNLTASPPVNLVVSFHDFLTQDLVRERKAPPPVASDIRYKLIHTGIPFAAMNSRYPFFKKSIYTCPAHPETPKPVLAENTNIIIVMAESFSKWFLSREARQQYRSMTKGGAGDLTPNLDALSREAISFENMLSPVRGTKLGHIAILGSWFEVDRKSDEAVGAPGRNYLFLSEILSDKGYRCLHIQGTSSEFNSERKLFLEHGFKDFYSYESTELEEMSRHAKDRDNGQTAWGYSDDVVFRFAARKLESMDPGRPFLMTVATMDTHTPYNGGNLLDGVHSTDKALGYLLDAIKNSPLSQNTALIFVADHAPRSDADYLGLRHYPAGGDIPEDWISAIVRLPGNPGWKNRKIRTVCSQTDIVPTLLDMMEVDLPNPFIGLSVFSDRPRYPVLVGLHTLPYDSCASGMTLMGEEKKELCQLLEWASYYKRVIYGGTRTYRRLMHAKNNRGRMR